MVFLIFTIQSCIRGTVYWGEAGGYNGFRPSAALIVRCKPGEVYNLVFPAALAFFHLSLAAAAIFALPAALIFLRFFPAGFPALATPSPR
jgi:hypothetical protein